MTTKQLDELEAAILRKRLAFLREQGIDGYLLMHVWRAPLKRSHVD